ncbi:hypothetical protein BU24DRAFT_93461 [Aaosphaeria arxii CBS 175.79]|uniref:Uncharacterized protein n=1 Tax=Aaosphaeria arxii CBS 175.79 TaxID=1450172 RepID=A0A6A5X6P9_9PLEO|nr:uncharacterized protein BU24DRAFT_93461 [Aaosphaeria arxii CBS 175.79]KAF2008571.1 hypothetical protein BU24DRAFT_93461 [Aaosphaeria arxii CBS 175.79]
MACDSSASFSDNSERILMGFARVGSNPTLVNIFTIFFFCLFGRTFFFLLVHLQEDSCRFLRLVLFFICLIFTIN